ncbi:MAG: PQQ-binding-like beta-propeller repeat protein [Verrucomicrobiota bacterium]|jgi:outer membrane protein assembly factor BamB
MNAKILSAFALAGLALALAQPPRASANDWLNWRGPGQNGNSAEKNLPTTLEAGNTLWTADFPGMSTPVIREGKLYIMGYLGEGPDLDEGVACFDAETGKKLWQRLYADFLSDTIYLRYATSSPAIDPETGNVYVQDTQGIFAGFSADGAKLWEHSMMEEFGRLTFPNGRTASPIVDADLVITRGITANWGANGPASDRFYAFDKKTGELVWTSSPGDRPKDNSYSHPILAWLDGKRVFYAATGDGAVICANARTGEPIFRIPLFKAGINSSLLLQNNDKVIAIYGTPYEPGQMVALRIPHVTPPNATDPVVVPRESVEIWKNEIRTSASSPILAGDRVFVTSEVGDLVDVDAATGTVLWKLKLGSEQRNSSPLYADGRIYAPILNDPGTTAAVGEETAEGGHGALYVIEPSDTGGKIVSHIVLDGRCYGTPTAYRGRIYMQTTKKLYCFGPAAPTASPVAAGAGEPWPAPGPATRLQAVPSEVLLLPNGVAHVRVRSLDSNGLTVETISDPQKIHWASFIPPTAKVKSAMKAAFNDQGDLVAAADKVPSAGAFMAKVGDLSGTIRGRVLPGLPILENFDEMTLPETTTNAIEPPTPFAYPPLPWIGARFKFEVRQKDGENCLVKTIDNPFFQRAFVFLGTPDLKDYTIQADVMSEGNKRKMSDVGLINQRYLIMLKGNEKKLEITSNQELLRVEVPLDWDPNVWFHLKTRVDAAGDGSGVIRAKAWKRGDPEPASWTSEVPVQHANASGCPGLFGFSPQGQRVFIDNISVTAN